MANINSVDFITDMQKLLNRYGYKIVSTGYSPKGGIDDPKDIGAVYTIRYAERKE